jgi:hypothetical protein
MPRRDALPRIEAAARAERIVVAVTITHLMGFRIASHFSRARFAMWQSLSRCRAKLAISEVMAAF